MKRKLLALTLLGSLSNTIFAKVVSLDIVQIYQQYSLVQEANQKIDSAEAGFKRILETAEKELKELEAKGNQAEIEKKKNSIQDVVDDEVEKIQDEKEFYNTQINRSISKQLQDIAKEKGIDLVIEKGYVQSPIEDITAVFLTRLEAARKAEAKIETRVEGTVETKPKT